MATAVGTSFDISKLGKELDKLDKQLDAIVKKGDKAKHAIEQMLLGDNANNFLNKIEKIKKNVIDLSSIKDPMKWDSSRLKGYIDQVNRLLRTVNQINTVNGGDKKLIDTTNLVVAKKELSSLLKEVKSLERAQSERSTSRNQTYSGALKYSSNVKNLEQERQAIINLEAARNKLKKTDSDYANKLNTLNDAIQRHERNIKDSAKTDQQRAAEAKKASDKIIEAHRREREEYEKRKKSTMDKWYSSNSERALKFSSNAKTLEDEARAIKYLEAARAKLNTQDKNYDKNLATLNSRIREHKKHLDDAKRGAQELQDKHKGLMNTGEQLKRALLGVFSVSAIKGYVNKLVEVRGEFELQHKSLQVLIQDADKANKLWDKTVALAINSPFRVKDLVTYTKQLAAYRVETDKLYDKTKMLADVSAGLGVDMNRLILAYGQVKAANFLRGTELRQFTEAGIPMLEKLAEYFSEMENKAVSAADVFERISKRGVSFEDVDAVLERMTSEGGEFYKMQEKQAETLKGMINNLRDSIDLMLSDIGENQEGKLKGVISATKDIVDNWRAIAVAIKQVGLAIAFVGLKQFALGWRAVTLATFEGTAAMSGASKIAATLRLSLQKLFATMKAHPLMFLAGAAISAGHAMWNYSKSLKEVNKRYDELSAAELRRADALNKVKKQVDNNNSVIKDSKKSQDEHNEAIKRNEKILKDLKRDYPDIYSAIVKQKDGTVELTAAIEEQNRKLQANIALQQQAKGRFFQESQSENYKDAIEDQSALQSALYRTKAVAMEMGAKLKYAVSQGQLSEEDASGIEEWIEDIKKATTAKEVFDARWNTPFMTPKVARTLNVDVLNKAVSKLSNAYNDYNGSLEDLGDTLDNQMDTFKVELSEINTELGRGTWLQQQLNNLGILDKEIQIWAKDYIEKKVELKITFPQPDEENVTLKSWQETYNRLFGDNDKTLVIDETHAGFKKITNEATKQSEVIDRLQAEWKSYDETIKKIEQIGVKKATGKGGAYEGVDYKQQIQAQKEVEKQLDFFGAEYEKNKKNRDNEALQRLKKQISLIREAAKAYDDMRKLHDEAYASERIVSDYEDAFKEAGLGNIGQYAFGTREDERNNLNKLEDSAKRVKGGMLELSKAIAQVSVNIDDANQELSDKKLFDAISDIFSNYEISLEMDKLNIPSDLAEKIFGFEAIDLNDIRRKVLEKFGLGFMSYTSNQEIYESDLFKSMSKERRDELRKSLEKESELQDNALKERLKTYTEYLKKEQDERIKIKLEELRKIEEVEGMNEFNEEQKAVIKNNIRGEAEAELLKKSWESFEKSPDFLNLFDDISRSTTQSLVDMRTQLDGLRSSMLAAGLPASDLKEILDKINQVEEELDNREPFKAMKEDWKTLFGSEYKKALEDEKRLLEERNALRTEQKEIEKSGPDDYQLNILNSEKEKLESMVKGTEEYETQKQLIADITAALYPNQQRYNEILELLKKNGIELDEVQQKTREWKDACLDIAESFNEIGNAVNQVGGALGTTLEQLGFMSEESKAIYDSHMNMANDLFGLGSNAMQLVANPTNPQAWIGAITSAISLIGNIAATGDAVREKEIQAEMKKIDRLEKAYEKLEKAMDEAYTIDQMRANKASMEQNIDAQIKALESANAKEEAMKKKDQDQIDANYEKIAELEEKKAELQRETVERLGGTYDYASVAEQFLDAWLTAFEETGDGLSGLDQAFDEFWKDILKKQVIYRGASDIVKNYVSSINKALEDDSIISDQEEKDIAEAERVAKEKLDAYLAYMNEKYNLANLTEGELSGLQAGIQGITETQADILAAYWNAVRFDVSAMRQRFDEYMASQGFVEDANPMLTQLQTIANNTGNIYTLLTSVFGPSDSGPDGIRVFVKNWN